MSTDRETTRLVRSWLEDGVTALPDRVLDSVLDQLPATPQRRPMWLAWRSPHMFTLAQAAVAVAAVLVVSVVAYSLIPRNDQVGPPQPTPSPSPPPLMQPGAIKPGTFTVAGENAEPFTVRVPAGWTLDSAGFVSKGDVRGDGVGFTTWNISHVYSKACTWLNALSPVADATAAVAALAGDGLTSDLPKEVTFGGIPAMRVTLSLDRAFALASCTSGAVRLWPDSGPDEGGGWRIFPGQSVTVWAMQSSGKVFFALSVQHIDTPRSDVAELEGIVNSVQFPK